MTVGEVGKNLPWVEKYRPLKLEDLVSHDDIIKTINQFMKENQLPHLLFYGPPGTGKTSTILACAKQMYTPQQFNSMVLELNASDDRGIGIVRGQILSFASTRTIFKAGPKLIILDEADAMTNDAQNALRRRGGGATQGAEVTAAQWAGVTSLQADVTSLRLCDVAGSALHTYMLPNYLYDSDIVIFVYDLTNLQSFEMLNTWVEKVKDIMASEAKRPLLALFGNKSDLEHQRAVRLSDVQKFASEYFLDNFKGSARTGDMITTMFSNLLYKVLGIKIPPEVAPYKKTLETQISESTSNISTPVEEVASTLIVNRKVLRKLQRKSSSSMLQLLQNFPVIEKYTENVRFCIICNYLGKIIPALQSRCTRFRFAPLHHNQIVPRLKDIAQKENVTITEDGIKALLTLSGGDMRKVLNTLQSTWLAYKHVSEDNVYTCVGHPLRSDISYILNCLLNENDFGACFKQIQDLKIAKGLALGDILTEIHTIIHRVKFPPGVLITLLIKMADSEARLAAGCSERIELAALISAFQLCKDEINVEELAS